MTCCSNRPALPKRACAAIGATKAIARDVKQPKGGEDAPLTGVDNLVVSQSGDIFVADGHVNSRIVKFSKDGKFITVTDADHYTFVAAANATSGATGGGANVVVTSQTTLPAGAIDGSGTIGFGTGGFGGGTGTSGANSNSTSAPADASPKAPPARPSV